MSEIKAGVVVVTKFCRSSSSTFSSYIDYIDRKEAVRAENSAKYNLYQDYMGNPEKTTGLFTEHKDITSDDDKKDLKDVFKAAQKNGSLMWQTVISFDNEWLENNGLYKKADGILDEERLKGITKSAIHKMLEKEGLENAVWSAAIHYNTDNIHIHIATVEPEPMREKRDYIQYDYRKENGRYVKSPKLDANGQAVTKSEYKGTFKQSSIETCKREMVNQIINERENNLKINSIIRESIVKQKGSNLLSKDKELAYRFMELYKHMPDCARNMWNYNNPIMHPLRKEIDHISNAYLEKYHKKELKEFQERLQIQEQKYRESYGENDRNYAETKTKDLYTRLGNAILKEIRQFDKEYRAGEIIDIKSTAGDLPIEKELGVTNAPLISELEIEGQDFLIESDVYHFLEENLSPKIKAEWSRGYKKAKKMIHNKIPKYENAILELEKEHGNGNILATYELGDIYRFGRGRKIDMGIAEKYYNEAFHGFLKLYTHEVEQTTPVKDEYLAYRLGKMYYYGLGTEENFEEAKSLFENSNSIYATYMLGKMAYAGQGMEQDYRLAYNYFSHIADKNAYAAYQAASMIDNKKVIGSEEQMQKYYEMAFEMFLDMEGKEADDNLEYRIGGMYMQGKGIEQSDEKAEEYLSMSAEVGNIYAKNKLAMLHLKQGKQEKLPEIIETLNEVAEKTDNIWSMYALGNIYASDECGLKDMGMAISWYLRAEKEGNEFISYRLGKIYINTESEWYDIEKAIKHMEKAMNCGNTMAAYQLGKIYYDDASERFNLDKAIWYFRMAAEQDNVLAAYQLGKIYMSEDYGVQDISKAIQYLEQAAKEDREFATYQLGKIYHDEKYGVKDDTRAYGWFLKSAEQGNIHASYQIGRIDYDNREYQSALSHFAKCDDMYSHYYMGKIYMDNEKDNPFFDVEKGISHMRISAEKGNSFAEMSLGIIYLKGELVTRDVDAARGWLVRAAEHGNEFAADIVKDMERKGWYYPQKHIHFGVSMTTALSKMKKGLKNEWEKSMAEREHEHMMQQARDD